MSDGEEATKSRTMSRVETVLASDAMCRLTRTIRFLDPDSGFEEAKAIVEGRGFQPPPFDDALCDDLAAWQKRLHALGWPDATKLVRVSRDSDGKEHWRELPLDALNDPANFALTSSGLRTQVMHACDFIAERAVGLSEAWWLARLTKIALLILEEESADIRMYHAVELGRLQRMMIHRKLHLGAVTLGRETKRQRSEGGKSRARPDREQILQAMAARIQAGQSIRQAARAVFKNAGLGSSPGANESVWKRAQEKNRDRS